ncbi:MAG TPA: hypothetical protein DIC31_02045 [Rhizobiales bacterium]|jgi:hypothetical protein|nr:hypothetical protein [Hyphomicrobiales bacterium]HBR27197.1 hypothetical protein [Hyphomicrobiales bacterium]HCL61259.1 hypothetical protein [Hyphomicrobiales bacterium]
MLNCAHLENERKGAAACRPSFARYAIYFTPQPGTALAAFGRSWFGRANDGITLQAFSDAGLSGTSFAKIAAAPGRYTGLHALFRAPFALRDGMGPEALKSRLTTFAARRKPVETGPLTLSRAGRFLVLRPVEATPALEWLAAQCVGAFEDFAAPPSDTEREEHASPHLSDYQRLLLESFGDPFVLSEYRFAITLTGPLDAAHLERVAQALWPVLEEICASGVTVDGLSLFGDPGGRTPMRLVGRYRLGA